MKVIRSNYLKIKDVNDCKQLSFLHFSRVLAIPEKIKTLLFDFCLKLNGAVLTSCMLTWEFIFREGT